MKKGKRFKSDYKKNKLINLIIIILLIILIISIYKIVNWFIETKKDKTESKQLIEQVIQYEEDIEKTNIDFDRLLEINNQVVGWIMIDGTNINYPILQAEDNDYYLRRNIEKKYSISGSIFMDYRNTNFLDKNTVIYGHNMNSGNMFNNIMKIYKNKLGEDIIIKIYTPEKQLHYKVFSCYVIEPETYGISTNIKENQYKEFNEKIKNRSEIEYNVNLQDDDKILTLFTCTVSGKKRILVHAVLTNI